MNLLLVYITGLSWIPSCAQVMTSRSSSRVPYPPACNFHEFLQELKHKHRIKMRKTKSNRTVLLILAHPGSSRKRRLKFNWIIWKLKFNSFLFLVWLWCLWIPISKINYSMLCACHRFSTTNFMLKCNHGFGNVKGEFIRDHELTLLGNQLSYEWQLCLCMLSLSLSLSLCVTNFQHSIIHWGW